jgi:hypothetical protein
MVAWRQRSARIGCCGEMHRVVLYGDGRVARPDHGPQHAALAAIAGRDEDMACSELESRVRTRLHGGLETDIPAKLLEKCEEISLANALATANRFRFLEGRYASVDVLLHQWKVRLAQNSTVLGQEPIDHVFRPGAARDCCLHAAELAVREAEKRGMLGCARAVQAPRGCSDKLQHAAVAVADRGGRVRLAHGSIRKAGDRWRIDAKRLRSLWTSSAFDDDPTTYSGLQCRDLKVWALCHLARSIESIDESEDPR